VCWHMNYAASVNKPLYGICTLETWLCAPAAVPWCFLQLLLEHGHTVLQHTARTVQHA
jgi:hypothetical protein